MGMHGRREYLVGRGERRLCWRGLYNREEAKSEGADVIVEVARNFHRREPFSEMQ